MIICLTKIKTRIIIVVLISCILLELSSIKCAQLTQYNYTFNLHSSKLNDLSQINGIKLYDQNFTGQVLDEFLIKEPKQIDNVVQIIANFNNKNSTLNISIQTQTDPNQLLSAPQIDKVWIDSYTWPIKKNSIYYSTQLQQKYSQKQNISIVSAVYVPIISQKSIKKILNDDLQIYVLLSTGQIQLISKNHQQLTVQKTYEYDTKNQNHQLEQWTNAYLYHKNDRLHLFIDQAIYYVSLNEIDNGKQKRVFYGLYQLIGIGQVLKVVQTHQLFIFTNKACYKANKNEPEQVINYTKIQQLLPETKKGFVDFTVFENKIYFLNKQSGVIVYIQGQFRLLRIQHPEIATQINVYNQTIMITYEIADEEYVQQYHFDEKQKELFVNKIYTYHSEESINDILLFEKEMILNRGSQILFGIHSLSRKLPQAFQIQSQVLESKSFNDQVIELRSIWSEGMRIPGYVAVTEKSIELIEFEPHLGQDIQQKWISITSQISGILNFDIQFIGTCKESSFYPPEYCSITKSVKLTVNDRVNEQIMSWWIWICIAVGLIFLLSLVIAILCTYFSKKQNQFESLMESKKLRKQGSTVVEMSFENTSQITEEKEK